MSGNNTGNSSLGFPSGILGGLGGTGLQNTWTTASSSPLNPSQLNIYPSYQYGVQTPAALDPKTASDLIAQLEHDHVIVADHKLLFGQYMGKSLREVPLEYIVQLGAALRGGRIQVAKELRRRRALERLCPVKS